MKGFEWPADALIFDVKWKAELPILYYIMYAIIPAAILAIVYFSTFSAYLVEVTAAITVPIFIAFYVVGVLFHPMHYGKRRYNDGYLVSGKGYFGISGKKSKNLFARFDPIKTTIRKVGGAKLKFSNLHPVLVFNNLPVEAPKWSWVGTSISVNFNSDTDLENFMNINAQ